MIKHFCCTFWCFLCLALILVLFFSFCRLIEERHGNPSLPSLHSQQHLKVVVIYLLYFLVSFYEHSLTPAVSTENLSIDWKSAFDQTNGKVLEIENWSLCRQYALHSLNVVFHFRDAASHRALQSTLQQLAEYQPEATAKNLLQSLQSSGISGKAGGPRWELDAVVPWLLGGRHFLEKALCKFSLNTGFDIVNWLLLF